MYSSKKVKKQLIRLSDPKLKEKLLDHWQKIPVIKEIPEPMPTQLITQEIRSELLDVMREGVEEYNEEKKIFEIRHAFSVKELHRLIKERVKTKIKISNVYFHLNKLKEKDYIEIVTSIREGRQITHFFGRTAKLFLWIGTPSETDNMSEGPDYHKFTILLEHFAPNVTPESSKELYAAAMRIKKGGHEKIRQWIEKNEEKLMKLSIDTRDLYQFLISIYQCDPTVVDMNRKIARLIDFPCE